MEFYVPETKGYRVSGSYCLFPSFSNASVEPTMADLTQLATNCADRIKELKQQNKNSAQTKEKIQKIIAALRTAVDVQLPMVGSPSQLPRVTPLTDPEQRVVTLSHNPTAPAQKQYHKLTHKRVTRANTPMQTAPIQRHPHAQPISESQNEMEQEPTSL